MPSPVLANIVFDLFLRGGPVMWLILLCLIAALVVVVERSLWWWTLNRRSDSATLNQTFDAIAEGRFEQADQLTAQPDDPFLSTIHDGLHHAHASLLGAMQLRATDELEHAEKRLWMLGTFITLAPLLGTVTGINKTAKRSPPSSTNKRPISVASPPISTVFALNSAPARSASKTPKQSSAPANNSPTNSPANAINSVKISRNGAPRSPSATNACNSPTTASAIWATNSTPASAPSTTSSPNTTTSSAS